MGLSYATIRRSTVTGNALVLPNGTSSQVFIITDVLKQMKITRFIFACETTVTPSQSFTVQLFDRDITGPGVTAAYRAVCAVSPSYTGTTADPVMQTSVSLSFCNNYETDINSKLYVLLTLPGGGLAQQTNWAMTIVAEEQSC